MKRFREENNNWIKLKALGYFLNFINNHKGFIEDSDTFLIVKDLLSGPKWIDKIRATFSASRIRQLERNEGRDSLDFTDPPEEQFKAIWNQPASRSRLRRMLAGEVAGYLAAHPLEDFAGEDFPRKIAELQNTFHLSDFETETLLVLALLSKNMLSISDIHHRRSNNRDMAIFVAKSLDCDMKSVLSALSENGRLRRFQCIDDDLDFSRTLLAFLDGTSDEPLCSSYFKRDRSEALPWDFYGELAGKHGEILKALIGVDAGKTGMNILLYGAPGTGKTSFAHTLAAELKRDCFNVVQRDENDSGDTDNLTAFRFAALQICDSQVDASRSLMIVDEADDMLRGNSMEGLIALFGGTSGKGDKGLLNSVLDTLKTPTIWISNAPAETLDESSRRRFDYSIKFEPLSAPQRLAIWKNNVIKLKLEKLFDDGMLESFSERYAISAGGIAQTLRNVAKLSPRKADAAELVHKLLVPHCELLGVPTVVSKFVPAKDYSLEGLNIKGEIRLERIVAAVRNFLNGTASGGVDRPRMNLLLSGPPGTGKTEFVKYLGSLLNCKVSVKMGSDLLDMYVGGTEQKIKQAFSQAEAEHSILFLDEIDGLVQSRERSQRSWEVSQVNELLYQMENFSGIMIGATNFIARLDAAILRRFTFKLEFDYLTEAGKQLFFEQMFQTKLSESERRTLAAIPCLAPGDFRTVRQSLFYLGDTATNPERIAALNRESRLKNQNRPALESKIGF